MTTLIQALQYTLASHQKWTVGDKPKLTMESKAAAPAPTPIAATAEAAELPITLTVDSTNAAAGDGKSASEAAPATSPATASADAKSLAPTASPATAAPVSDVADTKKTASQLEAIAKAIADADAAELKEANTLGARLNNEELTLKNLLLPKANAWINAAKKHEEEFNLAGAIRCYRNAVFAAPSYLLKNKIFKLIEPILEKVTKTTVEKNRIAYLLASLRAYKVDNIEFTPANFAKEMIDIVLKNNISTQDMLTFLQADVAAKIFTAEQSEQIRRAFINVLASTTPKKHLADFIVKNSNAKHTIEFLAASHDHDLQIPGILVETCFNKDLQKDSKLCGEFKTTVKATFKDSKDVITAAIKVRFNESATIQTAEYVKPIPLISTRNKDKENAKLGALNEIKKALNPGDGRAVDFAEVLALVVKHKNIPAVMSGSLSTKTPDLLNGLELALTSLGYVAKPAVVADEKNANRKPATAPPAGTASATEVAKPTDTAVAAAGTVAGGTSAFGTAIPAPAAGAAAAALSTPTKATGALLAPPANINVAGATTPPALLSPGTAVTPLPESTAPIAGAAGAAQPEALKPKQNPAPAPAPV